MTWIQYEFVFCFSHSWLHPDPVTSSCICVVTSGFQVGKENVLPLSEKTMCFSANSGEGKQISVHMFMCKRWGQVPRYKSSDSEFKPSKLVNSIAFLRPFKHPSSHELCPWPLKFFYCCLLVCLDIPNSPLSGGLTLRCPCAVLVPICLVLFYLSLQNVNFMGDKRTLYSVSTTLPAALLPILLAHRKTLWDELFKNGFGWVWEVRRT